MKKYKVTSEVIPTLIILFFGIASLGRMYFLDGTFLRKLSILSMAIFGLVGNLYVIIKRPNKQHFRILFVLSIVMLLSSIHTGNYRGTDFFMAIMYLGIGIVLVNFKLNYKLVYISFILFTVFFLYKIPFANNVRIFHSTSRNYHSVIMIYNAILVYIASYQNSKEIRLFPALITFVISVLSIGRSGIITSGLLLWSIFVIIHNNKKKSYSLILTWLFSIILILTITLFTSSFFYEKILQEYFSRLYTMGLDDPARLRILNEYIGIMKESSSDFLLGVSIRNNHIFMRYGYNLHNSFLRLHSLYGIFGIIIVCFLSLRAICKYWKSNNLYLFLLLVIFIRSITDITAFYGIFDPLLYFLIIGKKEVKNCYIET